MNYGVFKSFVGDDEEQDVINILENLEKTQDVKEVKIKSANAKTVIYIVTSDKRFETQTLLNPPRLTYTQMPGPLQPGNILALYLKNPLDHRYKTHQYP